MKVRAREIPDASPCACGALMRPAKRYEATRTIDVWWCIDGCGAETPPYGAPSVARAEHRYCRYCGEAFIPGDARERYCSDDHARRADTITLDQRHVGGQLSRRPA